MRVGYDLLLLRELVPRTKDRMQLRHLTVYLGTKATLADDVQHQAAAHHIRVSVVQPSVPLTTYWEQRLAEETTEKLKRAERGMDLSFLDVAVVGADLSVAEAVAVITYSLYHRQIPVVNLNSQIHAAMFPSEYRPRHPLYEDSASLGLVDDCVTKAVAAFLRFPPTAGRLVVFEGGDGAGKETQTRLLVQRLMDAKTPVETLDFPKDTALCGLLIREMLGAKHKFDKEFCTAMFALNRFDLRSWLQYWLLRGKVVVLDRYMTANFGYYSVGCDDVAGAVQKLKDREIGVLGLPPPDAVLYLNLPPAQAMLAMQNRESLDVYETMANERKLKVLSTFLYCCTTFPEWKEVKCLATDGQRRSREDVHEDVISSLHHMGVLSS